MAETLADKRRAWPIRVIALLLLLQALGLVGLNLYNIDRQLKAQSGLSLNFDDVDTLEEYNNLLPQQRRLADAVITGIFLMPLAVVALAAAISFFFLFQFGWVLAMITQTVVLLVCLMLYIELKPGIVYPVMAYSILMVLYLNIHEVRLAFRATDAPPELPIRRQQ